MINGANVWNLPVSYDKLGVRYRFWRDAVERGDKQLPFSESVQRLQFINGQTPQKASSETSIPAGKNCSFPELPMACCCLCSLIKKGFSTCEELYYTDLRQKEMMVFTQRPCKIRELCTYPFFIVYCTVKVGFSPALLFFFLWLLFGDLFSFPHSICQILSMCNGLLKVMMVIHCSESILCTRGKCKIF